MLQRIVLSLVLLFIQISPLHSGSNDDGKTIAGAKPIDSSKLFKSGAVNVLKLHPNKNYFLSHIYGEEGHVIYLNNLTTEKVFSLMRFSWEDKVNIKYINWIEDRYIYIRYTVKGKELKGFFSVDMSKEKPSAVFKRIKVNGYVVEFIKGSEKNVLFARYIDDGYYDLYRVSLEELASEKFTKDNKFHVELEDGRLYFSDSSSGMLVGLTYEDDDVQIWLFDHEVQQWKHFYALDDYDEEFEPVGYIDNNTLAVLSNEETDLNALIEFNIRTKKFGKVIYQHEKYDLVSAELADGGGVDHVSYIDHGRLVTKYFAEKDKNLALLLQKAFPDKQIVTMSSNDNSTKKVLYVFASDDPGEYYVFDTNTKEAKHVATEHPQLEGETFLKSQVLSVKTKDGADIEAIFMKSEIYDNGVLLVYPHGGPVGVRDYDFFDPEMQFYSSRGYSVLKVNFRGSDGYGKKFLSSGKAQFGKMIEEDITAVVNKLKESYSFEYTCSMGSSYGGYSAMMLAIYHPDDYDCIIAAYGIYDLPLLFNSSNYEISSEEYQKSIEDIVGQKTAEHKKYSPFYLAEKIKDPVLLVAGKDDEIARIEQSNRMKYQMKQLAIDHETVFYDKVGHGHSLWKGDRHEASVVDEFIRRKLKLELPDTEAFNDALKDQFMLMADAYSFDYYLPNNSDLEYKYYKKAAEYGDSRGIFNLGSYYHRGETVERDLKKAVELYQKASELGYEGASYRLGGMYRLGQVFEMDYKKAYEMYQQAEKQGSKIAKFERARALCLGQGVDKAFEQCIELLSFNYEQSSEKAKKKKVKKVKKSIKEKRADIASSLFSLREFTDKENARIKVFYENEFDAMFAKSELDVLSTGRYRMRRGYFINDSGSHEVELKKDAKFGVEIELETDDKGADNKKTTLKVVWTTPEFAKDEYGNKRLSQKSFISLLEYNTDRTYYYELDEDWEMVEGEWKVEIYDMMDNKLLSESFHTVKVD